MTTAIPFPSIKPTSRSYSPGNYPQTVFEAQNGATSVVRFGSRRVNSELTLGFDNISDVEAKSILDNFEAVNSVWDYVTFTGLDGSVGSGAISGYIKESGGSGLRWRYSDPPSVTSVKPGICSVQCSFTGVLDGV